jgi:hypothetical protein
LPRSTGPSCREARAHPTLDQTPSRVLDLLSTLRPRAGSASPDVLDALQRQPRASPMWSGLFDPHPGSALRFSQPLSGFLASSSSTALFRAAAVPGRLPSERSPRKDRAPLSRPLTPSRLSTSVSDAPLSTVCLRFPRRPRGWRSSLVPPSAMSSLSAGSRPHPGHSDLERRSRPCRKLHPSRSLPPLTNPFTPTQVSPRQRPLLSWVLPLQRPSSDLGVSTRPDQSRSTTPSPEGPGAATTRTSSPHSRVSPPRRHG